MDIILNALQGKSFHLSDKICNFLAGRYTKLIDNPVPDINLDLFHPGVIRQIITLHREQFQTEEYIQSRILNPTTGTIDHLHAEITSATAVRLGIKKNYTGYALDLLRAAGHFHDSDRSFPLTMIQGEESVRHDMDAYRKYKKLHAANSTKRAYDLIKKAAVNGYCSPDIFFNDLSYLTLRHETGGEKEMGINKILPSEVDSNLNLNSLADIVTDADSLSYFDANILTNWEECGKDKILLENKVHFMYDRMTYTAQAELRNTIIFSKNHILGSHSNDNDISEIRGILLKICC